MLNVVDVFDFVDCYDYVVVFIDFNMLGFDGYVFVCVLCECGCV